MIEGQRVRTDTSQAWAHMLACMLVIQDNPAHVSSRRSPGISVRIWAGTGTKDWNP